MKRFIFGTLLLACAPSAWSAQVYKCKSATGPTIYQNTPCPENTKLVGHGSYEPEPDNPTQSYAAAEEAERIQTQRALDAQAARERFATMHQNNESMGMPRQREALSPIDEKKIAEYSETRRRWGKRMAGAPPPGWQEREDSKQRRAARDDALDVPSPSAAPHDPVTYDDCKQVGSSVHCWGSDGSIASGSIDAYGNGHAHGVNGQSVDFHRDPATGTVKSRDGACVKNLAGVCE